MAEETQGAEVTEAEPQGTEEETDWKALYEAEKAHSRKWEKQAKANKTAADELAKAQEAGKTADEQIAELRKRLDEKERAEALHKLAAKVAQKKGVPADLLTGDTEEEMEAWADRMLEAFRKPTGAKTDKPGKFSANAEDAGDAERRDFLAKLLGND